MENQFNLLNSLGFIYRRILKPVFFQVDAETIHTRMTNFGQSLGNRKGPRDLASRIFTADYPSLKQKIAGINFETPIGLAAGFDYEAKLTQILPALGFGFETVGTITNKPYGGNPGPLLGRLPKSNSLMVNKGFKNLGAAATIGKLEPLKFSIPVGVSIGRTNSRDLTSQQQSIDDIVAAFTAFEQSLVKHAYYELNISCPNLFGDISFYPPKNLEELLQAVDGLHLSRPVFIKMPIEKSEAEVLTMLELIAKHSPKGVIFGNLQKNRQHPSLVQDEVKRFSVGYFSGKPTFEQSNKLIQLTYQHYRDRLVIIGCGGVFSPEDAYLKISLGASLVQLITGLIFVGPQLVATINKGLADKVKEAGFSTISEAIGSQSKVNLADLANRI